MRLGRNTKHAGSSPRDREWIEIMAAYEAVIGLEVHVQLATASKLFCSCSTRFGQPPNTNVCEVCAGMPGALPVPNRQAVHYAALVLSLIHI